jgi:hypothetical protein
MPSYYYYYYYYYVVLMMRVIFLPDYKETPLFFESSLCLSRACLGRMIIFSTIIPVLFCQVRAHSRSIVHVRRL